MSEVLEPQVETVIEPNLVELKVSKCTQTKNDSYCLTLVTTEDYYVDTPFGQIKQKATFYMFTKLANEVGFVAKLDINQFEVVLKPYSFTNEQGEKVDIELKTLYPIR